MNSSCVETDWIIQYAILNYIGYYSPRFRRYYSRSTQDVHGIWRLSLTIPFNDANYFLDGVGIPKDTPQIRNAKIDLKNNLYMKQEHFNGMSQWCSRHKKGGWRVNMGRTPEELLIKVWTRWKTNWRQVCLTKQDMQNRPKKKLRRRRPNTNPMNTEEENSSDGD